MQHILDNIAELIIDKDFDIAADVAIKNEITVSQIIEMYMQPHIQAKIDVDDISDLIRSIVKSEQ